MRTTALIEIALTGAIALSLAGCGRGAPRASNGQQYETRGIVCGVSSDRKTIDIQHEDIPGFMPSMTMPFAVRDSKEAANLRVGDAISFRLTVTSNDFWIDRINKIPADQFRVAKARVTPGPVKESGGPRLREGDQMPLFTLTNQDGERITRDTFRGEPFVLTFVFTRCPIPNFCPRMSNNFSELQRAIESGQGTLAKLRLLSITLDPAFDTPAILKQYAKAHDADPKIWNFVTGGSSEIDALTHAFSVFVQSEGGTISHGLATALVDKDGNIDKIWRGNGWTPAEVIGEIGRHENADD